MDLPAEAIEKVIQDSWDRVDDIIDKYRKKCEQKNVSGIPFLPFTDRSTHGWISLLEFMSQIFTKLSSKMFGLDF